MIPGLLAAIAVFSYLLGGLNGAIIASKYVFHRDVRDYGSGNAGLTNFYNHLCWSWAFITWDEKRGQRVIEVAQNDFDTYTSFLKDTAIAIPDDIESVWLRTKVRTRTYTYEYSFDGKTWHEIPVTLDAAVLSDDHVAQRYGGFFTGAFVGLVAVDLSGYGKEAIFSHFDYMEI